MTREQLTAISARLAFCPFCGSADVHMEQSEDGRIRIECDNDICMATVCFHAGALFQPSLSMARWNSRKTKSPGVPTLEECMEYIQSDARFLAINPETFFNYYEARGWKLANGCKVKDWKALVRTWAARAPDRSPGKTSRRIENSGSSIDPRIVDDLINQF